VRVHISAKWIFTAAPFEKFLRGHVRTVPGNMLVKYEVRSFNRFGAISIYSPPPKKKGVTWPCPRSLFGKKFLGSCLDCPWEHVSNLKSVALTVLELLAFNAHFNCMVWLTGPLRTHTGTCRKTDRQTDRQTDTHRTNTLSPLFTSFTWRRR